MIVPKVLNVASWAVSVAAADHLANALFTEHHLVGTVYRAALSKFS